MQGIPEELMREKGLTPAPAPPAQSFAPPDIVPQPAPLAARPDAFTPPPPQGLGLMNSVAPPDPSLISPGLAAPMPGGSSQDLAAQVKEWMAKKKLEEEAMPPPLPEPVYETPQEADPREGLSSGFIPGIPSTGFSPAIPEQGLQGSQLDPSVANAIFEAAERVSADAASRPKQTSSPASLAQVDAVFAQVEGDLVENNSQPAPGMQRSIFLPEARANRSRSRGKRDSSRDRGGRGRSRSRGRGGPPGGKGGGFSNFSEPARNQGPAEPMESRTIELTDGVAPTLTRLWLKKKMDVFGRVEVCHMGNRASQHTERPWVRFEKTAYAEAALAAIKSGQVFLDGMQVQAEMRTSKQRPPPRDVPSRGGDRRGGDRGAPTGRRNLDFSARDLMQGDRRRGGRSSSSSRSRSRSRRRRR